MFSASDVTWLLDYFSLWRGAVSFGVYSVSACWSFLRPSKSFTAYRHPHQARVTLSTRIIDGSTSKRVKLAKKECAERLMRCCVCWKFGKFFFVLFTMSSKNVLFLKISTRKHWFFAFIHFLPSSF